MKTKDEKPFWKTDLNRLWFDFRKVYPVSFSLLFSYPVVSVCVLIAVFSSFYLDSAFWEYITSLKSGFADTIFSFGHWYGSGNPTLYLFILLYAGGAIFKQEKIRDTGLLVGESFVFSGFISLLFKTFFGRWRPFTNHGDFSFYGFTLSDNDHLSFTSGHANVAFALSMSLAAYAPNIYLKIFFYLLAVITGLSRIYHNQHWLSDVVVGGLISIVITLSLIENRKQSSSK